VRRGRLNRLGFPPPRACRQGLRVTRPVVKGLRIEVGSFRPNQSAHFRVNLDLVEQGQLPQWPKQLAAQNRLEVYCLLRLIIELHPQFIGGDDLERFNVIDLMCG